MPRPPTPAPDRRPEPLVVQTARTRPLGEPDVVAVGSTAHRHLEPTTGREYLHTEAVCTDGYERPSADAPQGFASGLAIARLRELVAWHDERADEAQADAASAEIAAAAEPDPDEAARRRGHARAARQLEAEYRAYADGYRVRLQQAEARGAQLARAEAR
ncbi:MAG TPA: hypothetical protein VF406_12340 [Thermodesulfobacteriota bacterium]